MFHVAHSTLQGKLEQIQLDLNDVESAIVHADGQVAEHKENNLEELTKKINEEKEKVTVQNEKLSSENLLTKSTPFKEALDELARTKKKFDESVRR